jgi:hypothetical protein
MVSALTPQTTSQVFLEAEPATLSQTPASPNASEQLDLDSEVIENSPVLQRWLQDIPDLLSDIYRDPSFRTRLRLGYSQFLSDDRASGLNVGVEDVLIGRTGLTVSGEYQLTFDGDRDSERDLQTYGVDLRYYALPLGGYFNIAPVIGYRHLETSDYTTSGANLGLRLLLSLSRTGAADISVTQSWVAPGRDEEVGLTTFSFGYALTHNLRLSTDIQNQNSPQSKDNRVGIVLEWML